MLTANVTVVPDYFAPIDVIHDRIHLKTSKLHLVIEKGISNRIQ